MSSKVVPRDVGAFLQALRKFCFGGREFKTHVRFEDVNFSKRTQPNPLIPGGVSHRLSNNYYYNRDARRTSRQPQEIYIGKAESSNQTPQLKSN